MRQQTNLVQRGTVFYFRKKVPPDLRDHYGCESLRKSLRQFTSLAEAKREAARLAAAYEVEFASLRGKRGTPPAPLTIDLIPSLVERYEAMQLAADDVRRGRGLSEDEFHDMQDALAAQLPELRSAYARGNVSLMADSIDDFLITANVDATGNPETARLLARELVKARIRVITVLESRNRGEPTDTPPSPLVDAIRLAFADGEPEQMEEAVSLAMRPENPVSVAVPRPRSSGNSPRLQDVVDYWKKTGNKSHRSTAAADTLVKEFTALHGDVPLQDIGKVHFVALRDAMLKRVTPATVQARFNLLKAAFTVCRQDDQLGIVQNPIEDVRIRNVDTGEKSRDAFTADQLQVLFDSEVFTRCSRPEGGKGEAAFWAGHRSSPCSPERASTRFCRCGLMGSIAGRAFRCSTSGTARSWGRT